MAGPIRSASQGLLDKYESSLSRYASNDSPAYVMAVEGEARRDAAKALLEAHNQSRRAPQRVEVTRVKPPARPPATRRTAPEPFADLPEEVTIMSPQEWAMKTHPELRGQRMIRQSLDTQLRAEYQAYAANQKAVAQMRIDARKANVSSRGVNQAADPLFPSNIPATPGGQAGYAALTGQPEDVQARILDVVNRVHGGADDPVKALKAQVIEDVLNGITDGAAWRALKAVEGAGSAEPKMSTDAARVLTGTTNSLGMQMPGLAEELNPPSRVPDSSWFNPFSWKPKATSAAAGPGRARLWVDKFAQVQGHLLAGSREDRKRISQTLLRFLPSPEQTKADLDAGLITAEEAVTIDGYR